MKNGKISKKERVGKMKKFLVLGLAFMLLMSVSPIAFADAAVAGSNSNSTSNANANQNTSVTNNNNVGNSGIPNSMLIISGTPLPADVSNTTQPTGSALQCAVFLPSQMSIRDAARCAGKDFSGTDRTISVLYTDKQDVSEVMAGVTLANYVGSKRVSVTGKNAIYLPPICLAVYELALQGANTVVVNKAAGQYDGKKTGTNYGISFIVFFQQSSALNSLEERWDVVALGFRK